jgi:hypothetical protein
MVINFFAAINEGDANRAIDYVAPHLGWFSVTEGNPRDGGRHFVARDSETLRDYFNRRVTMNERIHLVEIDVDYERARNVGHVQYVIGRTAHDLRAYGDTAHGKGAIDCDEGKIAVWSMGQAKDILRGIRRICPGDPSPPRIAIVCARR